MLVVIDAQRHQFGSMCADAAAGLAQRGDRDRQKLRITDIVEADDLDLSRHIDLQILEVLQQMRGDRVMKTDDSVRLLFEEILAEGQRGCISDAHLSS